MSDAAPLPADELAACARVLDALYAAIDDGDGRRAVAAMEPEVVFATSFLTTSGRVAVAAFVVDHAAGRDRRIRHALTDLRGVWTGSDEAQVDGRLLLHSRDPGAGAARWRFEREVAAGHAMRRTADGGWRLRERTTSVERPVAGRPPRVATAERPPPSSHQPDASEGVRR